MQLNMNAGGMGDQSSFAVGNGGASFNAAINITNVGAKGKAGGAVKSGPNSSKHSNQNIQKDFKAAYNQLHTKMIQKEIQGNGVN